MLERTVLRAAIAVILSMMCTTQAPANGLSYFSRFGPVSLTANASILYHPNGTTLTTRLDNFNQEFVDVNPLQGVWLEIALKGSLTSYVDVLITGGMLAPSKITGTETETVSGTDSEYDTSGLTWGSFQSLVGYRLSDSLLAVGGFRWDHFNTRSDFSNSLAFLDYKLNTYIPLIGLVVDRQFYGGSLTTGVVGWPASPPGHMTQSYVGGPVIQGWTHIEQDVTDGHFAECFLEYRTEIFDGAYAGIVLQWNKLHVKTGVDIYDWRIGAGTGTGLVTETFDRTSWKLGGSFVYNFELPELTE